MANKKFKSVDKSEAPKEVEDKFPKEKQKEEGGMAVGEGAGEKAPAKAEKPSDRYVRTNAAGEKEVVRTTQRKYPKQMWIEESYELLRLPSYVVAAAIEKAPETELSLDEVKAKIFRGADQ